MEPTLEAIHEKYKGQLPKPIVAIAADLGLAIYQTNELTDSQSGSLSYENGRFLIYVNERQPLTRKRFTIAHEIAHFLKHRDKMKGQVEHIDTVVQPVGGVLYRATDRCLSSEEKQLEVEANKIAAEILMPEDEFLDIWDTASSIEEVAEKFQVSASAATVRAGVLCDQMMI